VNVIVTDIEGTTSDIAFVQRVLFPYAREHLPAFVRAGQSEPSVAPWLAMVADEIHVPPDHLPAIIAALLSWIDADRKHTALKALQGQIWQRGFEEGAFRAHVYDDAVRALQRWRAQGLPIYVYSSGSVHAQRLYFAHTDHGDLSECFAGHFDTTTGPKREVASYRAIAQRIGAAPASITFFSDIGAELDAAQDAGWQTVQLLREGTEPAPRHRQVTSFDRLDPPL
jgi:enolase-phosphatase E1